MGLNIGCYAHGGGGGGVVRVSHWKKIGHYDKLEGYGQSSFDPSGLLDFSVPQKTLTAVL